jgi:hypothetical protein
MRSAGDATRNTCKLLNIEFAGCTESSTPRARTLLLSREYAAWMSAAVSMNSLDGFVFWGGGDRTTRQPATCLRMMTWICVLP